MLHCKEVFNYNIIIQGKISNIVQKCTPDEPMDPAFHETSSMFVTGQIKQTKAGRLFRPPVIEEQYQDGHPSRY